MSDQTELRLLVSSGDGPAECRRAVSHILELLKTEAVRARVAIDIVALEKNGKSDPSSAIVLLSGAHNEELAGRWIGTIQWTCKSQFRPNYKRQNWFVGVFLLPKLTTGDFEIDDADLKFETFRAGGSGGQHQNTTNSAVRVTHIPTGTVAISRDERSQHRNKKTALRRLIDKMLLNESQAAASENSMMAALHKKLERGNPVRRFKGPSFREARN